MDDAGYSGFTLFELLLTLSLVAFLAGTAVPAMRQFIDRQRLQGAAEALSQELKQARNHALTYQKPVFFSLNSTAQTWCYGWSDEARCDCRSGGIHDCSSHSVDGVTPHENDSQNFPSTRLQLNRSASQSLIRFSPVRATATAQSLQLSNSTGEIHVIVSPLGRIRLCAPGMGRYVPC